MWRWWIIAGLVVMGLGVAACGDGTHDEVSRAERNLHDHHTRLRPDLVLSRFYVGEAELFGGRDGHLPAPVDPSACGGPVRGIEHVSREREEHGGWLDNLRFRDNRFRYAPVAPLLDENRLPVGAYGLRVVVRGPLMDDLRLPDCVGKLPVQVVVVEWSNRTW